MIKNTFSVYKKEKRKNFRSQIFPAAKRKITQRYCIYIYYMTFKLKNIKNNKVNLDEDHLD